MFKALSLKDDYHGVAEMISYGTSTTNHQYIITKKYGPDLKHMLAIAKNQAFSI